MPAGTHLAGVFIFLFISPCFSNNKNDEKIYAESYFTQQKRHIPQRKSAATQSD